MRQLGIQVYCTANRDDSAAAVIAIKLPRVVNYAMGPQCELYSDHFPILYPWHYLELRLREGSPDADTAHVAEFLAEAAKSHGRVTVRPILNEDIRVAENKLAWRGTIAPSDRAARFRSYRRLLIRYARRHRPGVRPTHRGD